MANNLYSIASSAASSIGDYESEKIGIQESLRNIDFEKKNLDLNLQKISAVTDTLSKGLELAGTVAVGMEETASFKESIPYAEKKLQEIHGSPDTKLEQIKRSRFRKAMDYLSGAPAEYKFGDIKFSGKDDIADLKALGKFGKYNSMYNQMFPETSNIENKNIPKSESENIQTNKPDSSVFKNVNVIPKKDIQKTDEYGFSIDSSSKKINSYDEYVEKHGEPSNTIKSMFNIPPYPKQQGEDVLDLDSMWDDAIWNEIEDVQDFNLSQPGGGYYIQQTGLGKKG